MSTTQSEPLEGRHTPESERKRAMAYAILNNLQAIAHKYGGVLDYNTWRAHYDYSPERLPTWASPYENSRLSDVHREMMKDVERLAYEKYDELYPEPLTGLSTEEFYSIPLEERRELTQPWNEWNRGRMGASKFEQDAVTAAIRDLLNEVPRLLSEARKDELNEKLATGFRTLIKYGVSPKLAEVMEPEPDPVPYIPQTKFPERKKDK